MPALFTKPIGEITAADVDELIGWPEALTVEFKQTLPGKNGRPDGWLNGGSVDTYARDKLFKEIVAFANTSGGHLILGVAEDKGAPPTASSITPVPRCAELAERLSRAAEEIDPPIPLLLVRGIETENDGAGVVVFRVPASRMAPHRGIDKECYVRRGASSVPVGMREIQDMTLAAGRREERVDARFGRASAEFNAWMETPLEGKNQAVGFRITAIPVSTPLSLGRIYGRQELVDPRQNYTVHVNNIPWEAHAVHQPERSRPLIRGVRWSYDEDGETNRLDVFSDGMVSLVFRTIPRGKSNEPLLSISWIVAYAIKVLLTANSLRTEAGMPDCEYGLEVEIQCLPAHEKGLVVMGFNPYASFENQVGEPLRHLPLTLPRLSFGPSGELDQVISAIVTDLFDACGQRQIKPINLHVMHA